VHNYKWFILYNLVLDRDVALYALGVGAGGADPCNPSELPFVYHPDGQSSIKVLSFLIRHCDSWSCMELNVCSIFAWDTGSLFDT
jgi:hypothetical protein